MSIKYVNVEKEENLEKHRTEGFSSSKPLVVRRGAPFKISLQLKGRPFNPQTDAVKIKVKLGTLLDFFFWGGGKYLGSYLFFFFLKLLEVLPIIRS